MLIFDKVTCIFLFLYFVAIRIMCLVAWTDDNKFIDTISSKSQCSEQGNIDCITGYSNLEDFDNWLFNTRHKKYKNNNKRTSLTPLHDSMDKVPCQCEMTYHLMDLGNSIYPRYVRTGACKKNTCGLFHRCQPKKYKVKLLKKRDHETDSLPQDYRELRESSLPESLAEDWISDYVNIVIACECVPVNE